MCGTGGGPRQPGPPQAAACQLKALEMMIPGTSNRLLRQCQRDVIRVATRHQELGRLCAENLSPERR
jgi:hypothetical protein